MHVIRCDNYGKVSETAAWYMLDMVRRNPRAVMGVAWGHSPRRAYRIFVRMCKEQDISTDRLVFVQVDELIGPSRERSASGGHFLDEELFGPLGIRERNIIRVFGNSKDANRECARVAARLRERGGLTHAVLGFGPNGHIGFNEPSGVWDARGVHATRLAPITIARLSAAKREGVDSGITLGLRDLLSAGEILLIITGPGKAGPARILLNREKIPLVPATMFRDHPHCSVIVDKKSV